jgi:hypothetical protein
MLVAVTDKLEEMQSKHIAVGLVEQTMLTAIRELPLDRQITALRRYTQRMERNLSELSVPTVPAAEKDSKRLLQPPPRLGAAPQQNGRPPLRLSPPPFPATGLASTEAESGRRGGRVSRGRGDGDEGARPRLRPTDRRWWSWIFWLSTTTVTTAPHSWGVACSQGGQTNPAPCRPRGGIPSGTHSGGERAIP